MALDAANHSNPGLQHQLGATRDEDIQDSIEDSSDNYQSQGKQRRNVWTEKKNAALVEIVTHCPYPTPWKPKHGTAREIWTEIVKEMAARPDIFDRPIHWEAAKEQFNKIIERQRMRRSLGDFEVKSQTDKFIDEIIKLILAEETERASSTRGRVSTGGSGRRKETFDDSEHDRKRRHTLENYAPDSLLELSNAAKNNGYEVNPEETAFNLERERFRLEYELQREKQRNDREKEHEDLVARRDQEFMKFIQDQMSATQAMIQTTQAIMIRVLEKLEQQNR